MTEKEAISVLTQAVVVAQRSGIYSLRDSSLIYQALNLLNPDFDKETEQQTETEQPVTEKQE